MKNSEIFIKIVLAILMLLCLLDMPYGYYQLVRYLAMVGLAIWLTKVTGKSGKRKFFYTLPWPSYSNRFSKSLWEEPSGTLLM